jgi:hypothetical protein
MFSIVRGRYLKLTLKDFFEDTPSKRVTDNVCLTGFLIFCRQVTEPAVLHSIVPPLL